MRVAEAEVTYVDGVARIFRPGQGDVELIWHPTYRGSVVGFGLDVRGGTVITPWTAIAVVAYKFEVEPVVPDIPHGP